jgi:hypothetical protein
MGPKTVQLHLDLRVSTAECLQHRVERFWRENSPVGRTNAYGAFQLNNFIPWPTCAEPPKERANATGDTAFESLSIDIPGAGFVEDAGPASLGRYYAPIALDQKG